LRKAKANPDLQDKEFGKTPLHEAVENGQFNSLQILSEECKADVNICDKNGDTLLHYSAIGQGNATLYIKYLVEKHSMSVFAKNKNRLTPR
jgi:ankyrin repeat protein